MRIYYNRSKINLSLHRGEHLLHSFLPNKHVQSIFEITPQFLQSIGKKAVLVELDNTLVPWNVACATDKVKQWFYNMHEANIETIVFSNNNEERVAFFCDPLKIRYIYRAKKPLRKAFKPAQQILDVQHDEIVVIGDQLLTEIIGGNRAGFYTILVVPIMRSDALITKFNRRIERMILNRFYRQGKLTRRDERDE